MRCNFLLLHFFCNFYLIIIKKKFLFCNIKLNKKELIQFGIVIFAEYKRLIKIIIALIIKAHAYTKRIRRYYLRVSDD